MKWNLPATENFSVPRGSVIGRFNCGNLKVQSKSVITEECNVTVNSDELIGTTEYLTLQARCRINRYRYKRV
jgi:hypothetical protein